MRMLPTAASHFCDVAPNKIRAVSRCQPSNRSEAVGLLEIPKIMYEHREYSYPCRRRGYARASGLRSPRIGPAYRKQDTLRSGGRYGRRRLTSKLLACAHRRRAIIDAGRSPEAPAALRRAASSAFERLSEVDLHSGRRREQPPPDQ